MVSHLNQGLNPGLLWVLRCRQDSLPPAPPGKPQYNMLLLLFSHTVVSNSLQPHRLQHSRPPCPSSSPRVCLSSCSLHWRCHPAISSSDTIFSLPLQSFPASGTLPVSHLFTSGNQNTGASVLALVLPMSIQG